MRSRLAYNDNDLIMSVCIIHTKYMNFEFLIVTMGKGGDQDFSVICEICHLSWISTYLTNSSNVFPNFVHDFFSLKSWKINQFLWSKAVIFSLQVEKIHRFGIRNWCNHLMSPSIEVHILFICTKFIWLTWKCFSPSLLNHTRCHLTVLMLTSCLEIIHIIIQPSSKS